MADFHGKYEYGFGTVVAMRKFHLASTGTLRSCFGNHWWTSGENICFCARTGVGGKCGDPTHECGFWAYYDGTVYRFGGNILGIIEGYGKTTIGTKGVRVEKARIRAILAPSPQWWKRWARCLWDTAPMALWTVIFWGGAWLLGTRLSDHNGWSTSVSVAWGVVCGAFTALWLLLLGSLLYQAHPAPEVALERMRLVYPEVEVFTSLVAMKKKYPLAAKPGKE